MNQESLLTALDEPVFEIDTDGTVTFASPTFSTWADRGKDEVDYAFADVILEGDRARFSQMVKRIAEGKTANALVEVTLASNATPVEVKLARGRREGDKVIRIAGWLRDLTMEKAREAAANVQGTHLLDLVENVSDATVVENAEGGVEMVNSAFCDLFQVEAAAQSLVGMTCADLFALAAKHTDKQIAPIYFPLDSAKADRFEFDFTDGRRAEQHSMPVAGESGIAGRLHLFRVRANESSAAAAPAKGASATTSAQSQTVEKIARNLAAAVENAGSAIHRAEQLDLPGGVIENFRRVEDATATAFNEIAGLLDFSQLAAAEVKLVPAEFHLREAVASMFDNVVADAEAHRVQLNLSVEQDVPEFLTGDGARLMLVLRSLIEAGIPSVPGGELKLVIEPEYSTDKETHLAFRVEAAPPKGGTRNKTVSPSHQMQMSLARQIVRAMSAKGAGKIEVREKKETQIQQFTAVFPYRPGREPRERTVHMTLTAMPVLIVSADANQRKELAQLAKTWRMQPREADSAAVALQFLSRMAQEDTPVPLVLTANTMPVQDGFLLAFRIRYHSRLRNTAIMMIANSGKPGDAIACRENGISAYLRQPIAPNQINEAIFAVMGVQDEAESDSTLITRHSLREKKAGSVLVIDPNREHAAIAVPTLKKKDYRVIHADTAEEAWRELSQDVFDLIILDPMAKGFAELGIEGIADELTRRFTSSGKIIPVLLAVEDDISAVEYGFAGMLKKPYDREALIARVAAMIPVKG
ncbi:MAG: response regulator [Betaproteobacteria bacterium]|nr:response regulator [Betaproteobacteria bacterium]